LAQGRRTARGGDGRERRASRLLHLPRRRCTPRRPHLQEDRMGRPSRRGQPPRPPAPAMSDDDDDRPPPRLVSRWFWLALIFGLACVVAGLALAKLGPKYL